MSMFSVCVCVYFVCVFSALIFRVWIGLFFVCFRVWVVDAAPSGPSQAQEVFAELAELACPRVAR